MSLVFGLVACLGSALGAADVPDKTVVLTFDDAVKSHITNVAPVLKEHGFGATFFITHCWMDDDRFLTWDEVAELHQMGFEIGNHSWTHPGFNSPKMAARLAGELALVENELNRVKVPKPISFAWTGNGFGPEGVAVLQEAGYRFARRGMQPEIPYGEITLGPLYDPAAHHPLLIPSAGDAYPEWNLEHFKKVVDRAKDGEIAVVQFHGVPDEAHPWVHTPFDRFEEYMAHLKEGGFRVIALRDIADYLPSTPITDDPMLTTRYPDKAADELQWPAEVVATRADMPYWLSNMATHGYSPEEMAQVSGYSAVELEPHLAKAATLPTGDGTARALPYPGGRHPRIGFLDGAIDPQRGTKVSIFPPWEDSGYLVFDVPEAIFSNLGLMYLAHTHVPTIWDNKPAYIENVDWTRHDDGSLTHAWTLPNDVSFGASVVPAGNGFDLELWLKNGTPEPLTKMRTQICLMLKGTPGLDHQTNDGLVQEGPVVAKRLKGTDRWVLIAFDRCGKTWGNPPCPCMHSDPILPDAAPGERVSVKGRIWFFEGADVSAEIAKASQAFTMVARK
jgi:peptidoglycan/xylan/chitin deacetylase (PgdA/CDA1 family)